MTTTKTDDYPSRTIAQPTITARQDPVVHGDDGGPLDPEVVANYEEDGFVVLPGLLPPRVTSALNAELDRLAADEEIKSRSRAIIEPDGDELRSLFAVHTDAGPLAELARDPRLVEIARQLLGGDVYIHQSRINLKPGFRGKEFYWHSDFETWHAEDGMPRMRAVSCSVLLTPNYSYNGPLLGIAGSHQWFVSCVGETPENHFQQSLRRQQVGTPDDDSLAELARRGRVATCEGPAGTVVFFECNLMHGSNSNISPDPRRNVFLVYNSIDNALQEPFAAPAPRPDFIASRDFTPV